MPGFRRSQTTTQSLMCSVGKCSERAKDMCVQHMSAFCGKHYEAHMKQGHPPVEAKSDAKAVGKPAHKP